MCERILLQTLDFDLTVEHAYRRAPLPRRLAVAPRPRRRPRTRPRSGPDSTDVPVAQATACVREEHQGHARLGAGCVELYQRQPAHHHCSAGALPPLASRLEHCRPLPHRPTPPTPRRSRAQYPPRCVAASAVHLASRFLDNKMVLPTHHDKPWCALATHTHLRCSHAPECSPEAQPRAWDLDPPEIQPRHLSDTCRHIRRGILLTTPTRPDLCRPPTRAPLTHLPHLPGLPTP